MNIKFAQCRHEYGSYTDYKALIRVSGFEQCFIDEIDFQSDTIYVVSPVGGEYRAHIDAHRQEPRCCKLCIWQLERPGGERQHEAAESLRRFLADNIQLLEEGYADEMWISDRWMAQAHNDARIIFMPMGSHADLHPAPKAWEVPWKDFDCIHLSYISFRRQIFGAIQLRWNRAGWGQERAAALRSTKFLVNIHQDVHQMGEPLRIALAAAAGIPYITEVIQDPFPLVSGVHFVSTPFDEIARTIKLSAIMPYDQFAQMGRRMHELLCEEYQFDKAIRAHCRKDII